MYSFCSMRYSHDTYSSNLQKICLAVLCSRNFEITHFKIPVIETVCMCGLCVAEAEQNNVICSLSASLCWDYLSYVGTEVTVMLLLILS